MDQCASTSKISKTMQPWLVNSKDGTDQYLFRSIQQPEQCYALQFPQLVGQEIQGCFHGWLILFKLPYDTNPLYFSLWNPITKELIRLPPLVLEGDDPLHPHNDIQSCYLTAPPCNRDSVVLLSRSSKTALVICLLRNQTKTWTEISYDHDVTSISGDYEGCSIHTIYTPVSCNDKVYAITKYKQVIQIDMSINQYGENSDQVDISLSHCGGMPDFGCGIYPFDWYLVGSRSELFMVIVSSIKIPFTEIQSIQLFKLDFSTMKWEETESSNGHVFFLNNVNYQLLSCHAMESQSGGYIHIIQDTCKVYSYNMEDKTISLSYLCSPDMQPMSCPHDSSIWMLLESR